MGEVEKINLPSNYLKARLSDGFRKNNLAANIVHLAVFDHNQPFKFFLHSCHSSKRSCRWHTKCSPVRTIIAYADVCWRLPAMNQAVTLNWHIFRLSICGPVGPLNNCWASRKKEEWAMRAPSYDRSTCSRSLSGAARLRSGNPLRDRRPGRLAVSPRSQQHW